MIKQKIKFTINSFIEIFFEKNTIRVYLIVLIARVCKYTRVSRNFNDSGSKYIYYIFFSTCSTHL